MEYEYSSERKLISALIDLSYTGFGIYRRGHLDQFNDFCDRITRVSGNRKPGVFNLMLLFMQMQLPRSYEIGTFTEWWFRNKRPQQCIRSDHRLWVLIPWGRAMLDTRTRSWFRYLRAMRVYHGAQVELIPAA